jgi:3'(2'), 5'-bisphosphate nucleotidase
MKRYGGFERELGVAVRAIREAGAAMMKFYGIAQWERKRDASPVTVADHASNDVINRRIRDAFPDDAVLSEESADSAARLENSRVWIVDPLDGTKEFLAQNGEFSVLIALTVDRVPVLGVVYLPSMDVLYAAVRGQGAFVERAGERKALRRAEDLTGSAVRLVGSRSHGDPFIVRVQEELGITDVVPCGSAGVKCTRIADDDRDLYVHPAPYLKEWDTCAPHVILEEAGGRVTDCRGEPLHYNKPDPVQPYGIVAASPSVHASVIGRIAEMYSEVLSTR